MLAGRSAIRGGVHSTTGDLAILLQAFINGGAYGSTRLLSPTTVAAMTRDHNVGLAAPWGPRLALRDLRGLELVWRSRVRPDVWPRRRHGDQSPGPILSDSCQALLTTRSATDRDGFLLQPRLEHGPGRGRQPRLSAFTARRRMSVKNLAACVSVALGLP